MKYAVLSIRSKQYIVQEGDKILVQGTDFSSEEAKVLLFCNDDEMLLGKPDVKLDGIKLKVITDLVKGEKIKVFKYKAKSRYRKTMGMRPKYCEVLIEKLAQK